MKIYEFLNGQLIATITSGIVAIVTSITTYRRSINLESDWRKTLFKAAGSEEITMKEVQLLRTAVRYGKVDDAKVKMYSFFWFTNLVIDFCDHLRKKKKPYIKNRYLLTEAEQEVIRIFIRCLLKYNWEVNKNLKAKLFKRKNRETKYIKESYEKACEEYEKAYEKMENKKFNFKEYTENQVENKEKNEIEENKSCSIINLVRVSSFILVLLALAIRFLSEWWKWDVNISNETIGFAIIIAVIFFFLKE